MRQERRLGVIAGALVLLSVLFQLAAVPVAATDVVDRPGEANDLSFLQSVGASGSGQTAAMLLRAFGALLLIPLAVFLQRAIRRRDPAHSPLVLVLGVTAFLLSAASTALGFAEVRDVARDFVTSTQPQTVARAEAVLEDARGSGLLRAANVIGIVGGVGFGLWTSLVAWSAMDVGMLTRFLGLLGLAAGATTALGIPVGPFLFMGWVGSVGILALGWWPGGRPPSWDTGEAMSPDLPPRAKVARS